MVILTHTHTHTHIYIYIYRHRQTILKSKGKNLSSFAECRIRSRKPETPNRHYIECPLTKQLSYLGSCKNLNLIARPYDEQAISWLDFTASWFYRALPINMIIVVNFDTLTQASNFRIKWRHLVFLCWTQDSKREVCDTNLKQTEFPLTNWLSYSELS